MKRIETEKRMYMMAMSGLMMALILVTTTLFKFPIPMTQGFVHLGDGMIFLGVLLLGRHNGAWAAGIGSALGDILGGFAMWAPWTFVIKFCMAFAMGWIIDTFEKKGHDRSRRGVTFPEICAMIIGGGIMAGGYFLAERVMYGNWAIAALGIPWNVGQFILGIAVCAIIAEALCKTPARKYFVQG